MCVSFPSLKATSGASATEQCKNTPGVHNSCWKTCPQANARNNGTAPFKDYVSDTVAAFKDHTDIRFWSTYNEPYVDLLSSLAFFLWLVVYCCTQSVFTGSGRNLYIQLFIKYAPPPPSFRMQRHNDPFSLELRDAAFKWTKAQIPTQPVTSLWYSNNNDSEIVNVHLYDDDFTEWTKQSVSGLQNGLGSMVTEAGCRWYQGSSTSSGDPLSVINWLQALRAEKAIYIPGVFLCVRTFVYSFFLVFLQLLSFFFFLVFLFCF